MTIGLQVLSIIISIIVAASLYKARDFFDDSEKVLPIVTTRRLDTLDELISKVLREMQDDVERFFYLAEPPLGLGDAYHAQRRSETAKIITEMIWEGAKKQARIENIINSWLFCEECGRRICAIGTFLNLILLLCLLAIIAFNPAQITINTDFLWIILSVIALPILCALICYIFTFRYKQKFNNMRDL